MIPVHEAIVSKQNRIEYIFADYFHKIKKENMKSEASGDSKNCAPTGQLECDTSTWGDKYQTVPGTSFFFPVVLVDVVHWQLWRMNSEAYSERKNYASN